MAKKQTITVTVPNTFWDDHAERTNVGHARIVRRNNRYTTVMLDRRAFNNFLTDAEYYADTKRNEAYYMPPGLIASAKATVRRLKNVG